MAFGPSTISNIGGAVADIFGGLGAKQSAGTYREAAKIAGTNAVLADEGAKIRSYQIDRKAYQTVSGQQADVASAGFGASGSALDLLRDSTTQGHLGVAASDIQGAIDVNTFKQAQTAYNGQAAAADTAATGDFIGSALKLVAGVASLFMGA